MAKSGMKRAARGSSGKGKYFAAAAALLLIGALAAYGLFGQGDRSGSIPADPSSQKAASAFEIERQEKALQQQAARLPEVSGEEHGPAIRSLTLFPEQPTVLDTIEVRAVADADGQSPVTYRYQWKINNSIVAGPSGGSLPAGSFKKGDMVNVRVTPLADSKEGYAQESPYVSIQSAPPTLEMKELKQKLNETTSFQLVSSDPDGDKVAYGLEEPLLEGMTVDRETGAILWKPRKKEKGVYSFKASATDPDGAKTVKTFHVTVGGN